jgi:DNA-nicking Smr family endonuclease
MTRRLTGEDRALWEKVEASVRPLRPRKPVPKAAPAEPLPEISAKAVPAGTPPRGAAPAPVQREKPAPSAVLDPKLRRRLSRGLSDVDGRIDLHGMRQERAHASLLGYLRRAQLRGDRVVLVITGKGREGGEARGVLRQTVPLWFAAPEFRTLVAGYEAAGRRHGGDGALYVRLRRRD